MASRFSSLTSRVREHAPRARARKVAAIAAFRPIWHSFTLLLAIVLAGPALADTLLLRPSRVFDGVNPQPHVGWSVLVEGDRIAAVGPNLAAPAGARVIELPGATLIPE